MIEDATMPHYTDSQWAIIFLLTIAPYPFPALLLKALYALDPNRKERLQCLNNAK